MQPLDEVRKISIIHPNEIDKHLGDQWRNIQSSRRDLASPYYCLEFTQTMARHRADVRIAVLESDNSIQGFFPYHQLSKHRITSIGDFLSDYQGLIIREHCHIDPQKLLQVTGGRYFAFNHMPLTQCTFTPHMRSTRFQSLQMDLSGGLEEYKKKKSERSNNNSGSNLFRKLSNLHRRMEHDCGPVRFVMQETSVETYQRLIELKAAQFVRTRGEKHNIFNIDWVSKTLNDIFEQRGSNFGGCLSAIYAGDKLLAAHLGMRHANLLHVWFLTYDTHFSYYSPGLQLLKYIAEKSEEAGLQVFDFGKGDQSYKHRFHNAEIPMAEGIISRPNWIAKAVMLKDNTREQLKTSVVGDIWRRGKRVINA